MCGFSSVWCPYHALFTPMALQYSWKSDAVIHPSSFFCLVSFWIIKVFFFSITFKISGFLVVVSIKNVIGNFMRTQFKPQIISAKMAILANLVLQVWEHERSLNVMFSSTIFTVLYLISWDSLTSLSFCLDIFFILLKQLWEKDCFLQFIWVFLL